MKLRSVMSFVIVAAALLAAACNPFPETWAWNQKLTVEIETPEGTASGSAVTHVSWQEANAVGNYPSSYDGEATVVEVLPGQYLFALIGEDTKYIGMRTFEKEIGGFSVTPTGFASMSRVHGTQNVPHKYYPLLVAFTNLADPKTIIKVDPDNLSASFGPGVALKRITLATTYEKVTDGKIENVLTWWCKLRMMRARLNGKTGIISDNKLFNYLGTGSFRVGDCT